MKKINIITLASVVAALVLFAACSKTDPTKIPITTSSKQALELYYEARDLSEKLRNQESIAIYQQAIDLDTNFALAYLNQSLVMPTVKGFFEKLEKARSLMGIVTEAERLWILGFDAGVSGFQILQREYYTQLVKLYPEDERAHNLLGNHYFGQQEYERAIAEYKKALEIAPEFSQPYNQLGYAYRFSGNFAEAEKVFKKYIEIIPDDPNPYDSYGELQLKMGNYSESIISYRQALKIDEHFVASHVGIATNYNYLGEPENALKQLDVLLAGARNTGETRAAYFARAVSYLSAGDFGQALEMLREQLEIASEINDEGAIAGDLTVMGIILNENDLSDRAVEMYDRAWQVIESSSLEKDIKENNYRNLLYNSTKTMINLGEHETAKLRAEEYRALVEAIRNPFQIRLANELDGIVALNNQDYDAALEWFQSANPLDPYILFRTALAFQGLNQSDSARSYAEKAVSFNALNNLNQVLIMKPAKEFLAALN